MDPDANLAEQRELSRLLYEAFENDAAMARGSVARLIELRNALDEWIRTGGFLPRAWASQDDEQRPEQSKASVAAAHAEHRARGLHPRRFE